jgi:malonyl-CoA O-methyltransferase
MTPHGRRAFERAAATYDAHSALHQEIGRRLLAHLEGIRIAPDVIADLGCGTGLLFEPLKRRFPAASLIGVDIAAPMLARAAARTPWWKRALARPAPGLVCADLERLPLVAGCVQLAFSNLVLQWTRPEAVFAETARLLQAGGLFLFSSFGPDTLKELRAAFEIAGAGARVNTFVDMHDLGDALVHAGFADPVLEMEIITAEYDSMDALVRELHSVGSHALASGAAGLAGRAHWRAAAARYEALRRGDALPATFEVVYGHAWKVAPRKLADGRQVIDFLPRR